jgi:hypothetical protein
LFQSNYLKITAFINDMRVGQELAILRDEKAVP